jgi:hypothetical protein
LADCATNRLDRIEGGCGGLAVGLDMPLCRLVVGGAEDDVFSMMAALLKLLSA